MRPNVLPLKVGVECARPTWAWENNAATQSRGQKGQFELQPFASMEPSAMRLAEVHHTDVACCTAKCILGTGVLKETRLAGEFSERSLTLRVLH